MAYHFRNLVFEEGGVKVISYVLTMQVYEEEGILLGKRRVGGTSAGVINATLFAPGFSNIETRNVLKKLDLNNFMDDSRWLIRIIFRSLTYSYVINLCTSSISAKYCPMSTILKRLSSPVLGSSEPSGVSLRSKVKWDRL